MLQKIKDHIETWLPLMIEIEQVGHNPVKLMCGPITIEATEIIYRALTVCKTKYPEWYSVMAKGCRLG
jgi:hypothetical protein